MHTFLKLSRSHTVVIGTASFLCWAGSARAQDWNGVQQGHDQAVSTIEDRQEPSRDHIVVGIGGGFAPAYQGADDHRFVPVPAIDISLGRFFANLRNGIGLDVVETSSVSVGVSAAFMPGYQSKYAPEGIGKLSVGLGARAFTSVRTGGLMGTIGLTKGIAGGNKGVMADASVSYPMPLTPRLTLIPTIGTTWASEKYNDRYFGVSPAQALASGLPRFNPGSGFKDVSAILSASYRLSPRWTLGASAGVTSLLGDVADSPIVYHKTQPTGFLSLSYRFGH